jgi:Domain of unknown function (DUF5655)
MAPPTDTDQLWRCGNCGRFFANKNQSHSCGAFTVDAFLRGKSRKALSLYNGFVELLEACGPFLLAPAKTRVGFQVRMIFAAVNKLDDKAMDGHVVLTRRLDHPRFRKIEEITPRCYVHHFRIHEEEELDEEMAEWLREAYKVGAQEQILERKIR